MSDSDRFGITEHPNSVEIDGNHIYVWGRDREMLLNEHAEYLKKIERGDKVEQESAITQFSEIVKIPGLIGAVGLPDIHAGYAFPIGSVAAVDTNFPNAAISPEGIGYDINCGVCCIRTSLELKDLENSKEKLADLLFEAVPSGMGAKTSSTINLTDLNGILNRGLDYLKEKKMVTVYDQDYVESRGSLPGNSRAVSQKAKGKGLTQLGSIGSGNHYLEIQVVEEILDEDAAAAFQLHKGQILISIHTGSRGLGYEVCSCFLSQNDKSPFVSYRGEVGKRYIELMNSAANFAWANRAMVGEVAVGTIKKLFSKVKCSVVYDVAHNIGKEEVIGDTKVFVHRKGASRALPPGHPELPLAYSWAGQPVPVGGSMGTCSFILSGAKGAESTWYSTCHGSGRVITRAEAKKQLNYRDIVAEMNERGIVFRCGTESGIVEEAGCCYKDIVSVTEHSRRVGLTKTVARLRPIIVIKG